MERLEQVLPKKRLRFWSSVDDEERFPPSPSSPRSPREGFKRRAWSREVVTPKSKSLAVPASTRTDRPLWLPLTNLDRIVNPTFISVIFFYENVLSDKGCGNTFGEMIDSLKDSLAKVLVEFYPLAGRMALTESGLVDLQCNDAGAIFIEASVNVELSELGGPQPMPMLSGMDIMESVASPGSGLLYIPDQINPEIPVLVIQVSRFPCGSIAVAVNWHHTVADAFSGSHFMRFWSQIATGQALSLLPSHDRHLLKPRSPPDASLVTNGPFTSRQKVEQEETIQILTSLQDSNGPVTPAVMKRFILRNHIVKRLKETANDNTSVARNTSSNDVHDRRLPFTSAETVSAELWRLLTKARRPDDEEARRDRSRFFMFVEGRKRLGLPSGYFGNVVCSACAESTEDELLRSPLSYAASLIQSATRSADDAYFRSLIDWVEEQGITSSKKCTLGHVNSTGFDVAATFWTFFPLYEINFGWGKPVLSVRNAPPRKFIDGISMTPGPDKSGNMVMLLNLHSDRMDELERDPEFRKTAEPVP